MQDKGKTAERCEIVDTGLISSSRVQEKKPQLGKIDNSEGKKNWIWKIASQQHGGAALGTSGSQIFPI